MKNTKNITLGAMIASVYIILTLLSNLLGIGNGAVQLRLSEALCILPCFSQSAVLGLFIGCFLSNLFSGAVIWDIIFGSLATLIGAVFTYRLRNKGLLALLPPILSNTLILPFVLEYAYGIDGSVIYFMLTIGISEIISCGIFGTILFSVLKKYKKFF